MLQCDSAFMGKWKKEYCHNKSEHLFVLSGKSGFISIIFSVNTLNTSSDFLLDDNPNNYSEKLHTQEFLVNIQTNPGCEIHTEFHVKY
jgi:hypothetical protein